MGEVTTIGLDLAKHVFQVHGVDAEGGTVLRKQLRRAQVLGFFSRLRPCLVGLEACATAHVAGLLCARSERPRGCSAAEQCNERAPFHSITSSARASSDGGTVRPSVLAVWALMTGSNFDVCTTGRSAGLAPLRMRPV